MESSDDDDRSPSPRGSAAGGSISDTQLPSAKSNRTLLGAGSFSGGRGSTWTSSVPVPASDMPISNNKSRMMSRRDSTRMDSDSDSDPSDISSVPDASSSLQRSPSRPTERASGRFDLDGPMKRLQREEEEEEAAAAAEAEAEESEAEEEAEEQRPVRMSLMSLLCDDEDGLGYGMDDDDDDEDDDDQGGEYNTCCICMVRHKGTAFEPCSHSFCRLCSREMWVQGGTCPLCNNYILEILDIF